VGDIALVVDQIDVSIFDKERSKQSKPGNGTLGVEYAKADTAALERILLDRRHHWGASNRSVCRNSGSSAQQRAPPPGRRTVLQRMGNVSVVHRALLPRGGGAALGTEGPQSGRPHQEPDRAHVPERIPIIRSLNLATTHNFSGRYEKI